MATREFQVIEVYSTAQEPPSILFTAGSESNNQMTTVRRGRKHCEAPCCTTSTLCPLPCLFAHPHSPTVNQSCFFPRPTLLVPAPAHQLSAGRVHVWLTTCVQQTASIIVPGPGRATISAAYDITRCSRRRRHIRSEGDSQTTKRWVRSDVFTWCET